MQEELFVTCEEFILSGRTIHLDGRIIHHTGIFLCHVGRIILVKNCNIAHMFYRVTCACRMSEVCANFSLQISLCTLIILL